MLEAIESKSLQILNLDNAADNAEQVEKSGEEANKFRG